MSGHTDDSDMDSDDLDDIDLAEPQNKTFEQDHHVRSLFPPGMGRGPVGQQWDEPSVPRQGPDAEQARGIQNIPSLSAASAFPEQGPRGVTRLDTARARAFDAPERDRLEHDSGAALDSTRNSHSDWRGTDSRAGSLQAVPVRGADAKGSSCVQVDLLAPAFTLTEQTWRQGEQIGRAPCEIIRQRAWTDLDVDPSAVRFYELREVHHTELRPSGRYAVSVDRSGFTLKDMEDMMTDVKRMKNISEKSSSALTSLQELVREFDQDKARLFLECAEHKADIRRLQERCRIAETNNRAMKSQAQRNEELRTDLVRQINKLKEEAHGWPKGGKRDVRGTMAGPLSARRPSQGPLSHQTRHDNIKPLSARGPVTEGPHSSVRGRAMLYEHGVPS